jgi:Fe-S-cluster containining protein
VSEDTWFNEGLRFSCQSGCTRCCGGAPGDVFITRGELEKIAAHMQMSVSVFEDSYVRHYSSGRLSLTERRNGDCILLNANGCSVYEARPKQCRTYPFWPEVTESLSSWIKETDRCPGINVGEIHAAPKIVDILKGQ